MVFSMHDNRFICVAKFFKGTTLKRGVPTRVCFVPATITVQCIQAMRRLRKPWRASLDGASRFASTSPMIVFYASVEARRKSEKRSAIGPFYTLSS